MDTFARKQNKRFVFSVEADCVLCEVEAEFLFITVIMFVLPRLNPFATNVIYIWSAYS